MAEAATASVFVAVVLAVDLIRVAFALLFGFGTVRVGMSLPLASVCGGRLDVQPAYQQAAIVAGIRTEGKCFGQIQNCLFFQ